MKYHNHQNQKPLSASHFQYDVIPAVQSNLTLSVRETLVRASHGSMTPILSTLSADEMPSNFDRRSFDEKYRRYQELKTWFTDNQDEINKILNQGSQPVPNPAEPEPKSSEPEPKNE